MPVRGYQRIDPATRTFQALRIWVNDELESLDLSTPPQVVPAGIFPEGVNVEFVVREPGQRHVRMRVHERGVGETMSCGTGAVAVLVAVAAHDREPDVTSYVVDVPGGRLSVSRLATGELELRGPADIVATAAIAG